MGLHVLLVSKRSDQKYPLTFKVTGGLRLFHQTVMVQALSAFCMVVVAGGFGSLVVLKKDMGQTRDA